MHARAVLHNLVLFSLSVYMAVECVRLSYLNFGWGRRGFALYCNQNDPLSPDGGRTFSATGGALARVLYIHYISKVCVSVKTHEQRLRRGNKALHTRLSAHLLCLWLCVLERATCHVRTYGLPRD